MNEHRTDSPDLSAKKTARHSAAAAKPGKDTLVAILKAPRDLTIARQELWYRIPTRTAPNIVKDGTIRYLAF